MIYRLSPSLLSADFAHLAAEMARVGAADWIHVDVMDGHFVPNLTLGPPVVRSLARAAARPLDVHLMVERPSRLLDDFLSAGPGVLTLHVESEAPDVLQSLLREIRSRGVRPGITLRPGTDVEVLAPYLPLCDLVLVMSVEPGFGGQSFLPGTPDRIRAVRRMLDDCRPSCDLEVDGGLTLDNLSLAAEAGANVFVVGHAIFGAPDVPAQTEAFRRRLAALAAEFGGAPS
ncbi:MAG: ribulose-phosphate 3-epimerase [Oscillospiraceae bacterium]|jgi:ribulose-phosphate 3-epimerase|nr:ribulose-phosphate 3-epimerase [Oscillospiraceae bacterium]